MIYLTLIVAIIIVSAVLVIRSSSGSSSLSSSLIGGKYFLRDLSGREFQFVPGSAKKTIIYFSPDCESCIYEVGEISKHQQLFNQFQLYFLSDHSREKIRSFISKTNFQNHQQVFLYDSNSLFRAQHKIRLYPTILLGDNKGKIKRRVEGEMKIERLLSILNNE